MKPVEEMSREELEAEITERAQRKMEYLRLKGQYIALYLDWSLSRREKASLADETEDGCRRKLLTYLRSRPRKGPHVSP